jgi:hypothetical protein
VFICPVKLEFVNLRPINSVLLTFTAVIVDPLNQGELYKDNKFEPVD